MNVEGNLFRARRPTLVAEAIDVFAVPVRREGVVFGGDGLLEVLAIFAGILDLQQQEAGSAFRSLMFWQIAASIEVSPAIQLVAQGRRTQKSISRFPLPPNSLSPTWNETVILSSRCNISWKHSRECALSWMVCAAVAVIHPSKATSRVVAESRMINCDAFNRIPGARYEKEMGEEWVLLTGQGLISDGAKGVLSRKYGCTDHLRTTQCIY